MKDFVKQHIYIILGVVLIGVISAMFIFSGHAPRRGGGELLAGTAASGELPDIPPPSAAEEYVVIHIVGEVYNPGVFTLPAAARVTDAVQMAGGYTADADLFRVNLAAPLHDAMQIIIPAVGDYSVVGAGGDGSGAAADDGLICLNTATSALLQTIPGIGDARAASILAHRDAIGRFTHIEQLLDIPGIGQGILNNIRPFITIR